MRKSFIFGALAALSISSPSQANVFGKDDRIKPKKSIYNQNPFKKIVKVGNCTGALVGPDLVLTANHCVDHAKMRRGKISRNINVHIGRHGIFTAIESAKVIDMTTGGGSGNENDWAVLTIDKKLGNKYGYLKIQDHVNENYTINLFGFSADISNHKPSYHAGCMIRQIKSTTFLHDCDSTGGASGAPIWRKNSSGEFVIVGVHAGGKRKGGENMNSKIHKVEKYEHDNANVAVLPDMFYDVILDKLP